MSSANVPHVHSYFIYPFYYLSFLEMTVSNQWAMLSVVMSYLLVAQGHQVLTRKCTSIILCLHSKSAQKDIRMLIYH